MKISTLTFLFLILISFKSLAQTNTVIGTITEVKPSFAGEHALTVGKENTVLILITDLKDASGKTFEINKEYHNLLIETKDKTFVLNPKYAHKTFEITYTINGKGWKCINTLKAVKK
ncbi:MAG: hypothetical protein ABI388_12330 [Bacteroidia bacterium]